MDRKDTTGRSGFTLTEVLMVTALVSLVLSQSVTALLAAHRLYEATIADVELALRSHALREKLLFNLAPGEGGLMNACLSELEIEQPNPHGRGKGLKFKPARGPVNRLTLGKNKKLKADRGPADSWLATGEIVFQREELFQVDSNANGRLILDLDLGVQVSGRQYRQQNQALVQILNE